MNSSSGSGPRELNWLAAISIPMVLLIAPGVGGYIGTLADRRLGSDPFGMVAGIGLGLFASALRIRSILRSLSGNSGKEGRK